MARLSVIVPLYNCENFIVDCLRSLLIQQDNCDLDIIIVNDGSTDRSLEKVEAVASRHDCISVYSTFNSGVSRTRNVGLRHVPDNSDFVSFIDSDDVSPPKRFALDLAVLQGDPTAEFTYGRMLLTREIGPDLLPAAGSDCVDVRGISLSAAVFRKTFIDRIGFIDEDFQQGEDIDFLLRAFEEARHFTLVDTTCVYYRRHENNMTRDGNAMLKGFMLAIRKSLKRRQQDPSRTIPPNIFDIANLRGAEL